MAGTSTYRSPYAGRVIRYRGKRVRVIERDYYGGREVYWVRALEPVAGFNTGEELTVSVRTVRGAKIVRSSRAQIQGSV